MSATTPFDERGAGDDERVQLGWQIETHIDLQVVASRRPKARGRLQLRIRFFVCL